jgi:hypothetical protein
MSDERILNIREILKKFHQCIVSLFTNLRFLTLITYQRHRLFWSCALLIKQHIIFNIFNILESDRLIECWFVLVSVLIHLQESLYSLQFLLGAEVCKQKKQQT